MFRTASHILRAWRARRRDARNERYLYALTDKRTMKDIGFR